MGDDGGPSKKELNDSRADFFASYVMKSMRIKSDKWQKLIATDEYRVSIYSSTLISHVMFMADKCGAPASKYG